MPGAGEYCVIALEDRNVTGAEFGGSTNVDMGECCLISNAVHPNEAFKNTGNASKVIAGCIAAAGGVQFSNSDNWDVDNYFPYSEPAADPFADVSVPDRTACEKTISFGTQVQRLTPTGRPASTTRARSCASMAAPTSKPTCPGAATYVINTNGVERRSQDGHHRRQPELRRLHDHPDQFRRPANTGNIRLNGGTLNISAPVAPVRIKGIALYQDRLAADDGKKGANHINGNSTSGVRGVMYTPGRSLLYNGGGGVSDEGKCMQIVAKRVEFTGNSSFKMGSTCADAGLTGPHRWRLSGEVGGVMTLLHRLRRDQRGVAAIELALAAPILATLIMGAADVGSAFSRKLSLEQGAQRAVEKIMQTTELANVQNTIALEVAVQADVDESQVDVTFPRYCGTRKMLDAERDFDGFANGEPCAPSEQEAHYILIDVTDEYDPMFPLIGMGTKLANGNYLVRAKAGMRTK